MIAATAAFAIRISFTAIRPGRSDSFQKQLGDDAAKRVCQHGARLRLSVGGKSVHHTIHRLAGIVRVQRAEYEKARLGRGERERNRFEIAHLAHEHNIGVLAQRCLKPGGKRIRVARHFSLRDDAALVVVHEFDRFFDCHDVLGKVLIDVVDQRRLRRRFARTGWAGNKDQAAAQVGKFLYHDWNPQLLETWQSS